jgi:hypothetical protein
VIVANGEEMLSEGKCIDVRLKLRGNIFCSKFFVLTLEGCDIVLGVQWLRTLGPIIWDFLQLTMSFSWRGILVLLSGLQPTALSLEENSNFFKSSNKGVVLQLIEGTSIKVVIPIPEVLNELLGSFKDVFEEPKGTNFKIT